MIRYKSAIIIAGLFLFLAGSLTAQEDRDINVLLTEADAYVGNNQFEQALENINKVLQISPSDQTAIQKQINVYYLMNDNREALRLVENAIQKYSQDPELYYLRGIINNNRERFGKAIDDFNQALQLSDNQNTYKIFLGRGISYMNLLEYEPAMADFSKSIDLNDGVASSYHSRAMLNYELQDYQAAIDDFLKVLELSEGTSVLYFNIGMSYYRLSDQTSACPYFHKACTMGNNNACRMALMECAKEIPNIP